MTIVEIIDINDESLIEVNTSYAKKEMIKFIPGSRWKSQVKTWTVPLTWTACIQLRGIFGAELHVGPKLAVWSQNEFTTRINPVLDIRTLVNDSVYNYTPQLVPDIKLYDYQQCGVDFLTTAGSAILNDDMGTGKTLQALAALTPDMLPALIICPNSVKHSWEIHIKNYHICAVPYVVSGTASNRRKVIKSAKNDHHSVVIINIEAVRLFSRLAPYGSINLARCRQCDKRHGDESLSSARCEVHGKELNNFGFKTVILDEAHCIKTPHSKQTRAVWAVAHNSSVTTRWALTGTIISNSLADIWSILHFIAPTEYPNRSKFIDRYALQTWNEFGGLDVLGINPVMRDEFYKILDPRYRRTSKALVLPQLPKRIHSTRWVSMTSKQRKAYDDLENKLTALLDDGTVLTVYDHLQKSLRMMQLASSYADVEWVETPGVKETHRCMCAEENKKEHRLTCRYRWSIKVTLTEPSPKLDILEEILAELGGKQVVIAAQSLQLIKLAAKRLEKLNITYGQITGDVSEYDRQVAIEQFKDKNIRIILMTIDAGGTGVDGLQCSDTMIILQRSWKMSANVQLESRIHRIGSDRHNVVHVIDIVSQDSIEERVLFPRLEEKLLQLDEIQRDREQLMKHGITTFDLFTLDDKESNILHENLL